MIVAVVLTAGGCTTIDLHRFKTHFAKGDDEWIAARSVRCDQPSGTCSELHLVRGAACLRLAGKGQTSGSHLACAADELETGIVLSPPGTDVLRYREQLCDALSKQLSSTPAPAEATRNRLMDAATALYRAAPDSVAAQYYVARARYHTLQARVAALTPAERYAVCSRLKRTSTAVLAAMKTAELTPSKAWERFAERYQRLAFDLGLARRQAQCR